MKNYIILGLFVAIFTASITSCETSDLNTNNQNDTFLLEKNGTTNGHWNLINIKGGFLGLNEDYKPGDVKWTFNSKNSTLSIEDNISKGVSYDIIKPGDYHYYILNKKGISYLFIEDFEFGHIIRIKNTLKIDQGNTTSGPLTDGYVLTFKK